jgi:hypothetical protein
MKLKLQGIYLIQFNNGIKIGMAKNCPKRIQSYKSPWIKSILRAEFISCQFPALVENTLKQWFTYNIISDNSTEFITGIQYEKVKEIATKFIFSKPEHTEINRYFKKVKWITLID